MTLGEMTPLELLESANDELKGLDEFLTEALGTDHELLGSAYIASIRARVYVALDKLSKEDS